jgi:predicted house-cleaning NTP pyrophosphatase (Maf/HAM1 superfamily)
MLKLQAICMNMLCLLQLFQYNQLMKIYLASQSPRRRELLEQMEVSFEVLSIDTPEIVAHDEAPEAYSRRITQEKLDAAWEKIIRDRLQPMPVLCADTEVIADGVILGKPRDENDAFRMIKSYVGKTHEVVTSVGLRFHEYQKIVEVSAPQPDCLRARHVMQTILLRYIARLSAPLPLRSGR